MALLDLLGRRWTLRMIWELSQGPAPTFRELQARCDGVSSSVLSVRLGELADAGIVAHDGHGYALTEQGRDLLARLSSLDEWATRWRPGAAGPSRG
jgi:DNA-binding HxlR family transcriptional regulator